MFQATTLNGEKVDGVSKIADRSLLIQTYIKNLKPEWLQDSPQAQIFDLGKHD